MNRGRRAILLAGLAVVFAALAASEVASREAEIERRVGRSVPVVVASEPIARGARIDASKLAIRNLPASFAPRLSFGDAEQVIGARAAVSIAAGSDLQPDLLQGDRVGASGALVDASSNQRIVRLIVVGEAGELTAGARVDLLITRDNDAGAATTSVGLRDAEVIESAPAPAVADGASAGLPRVSVAIRVTLRQAVSLAEAQNSAREIRALPRPPEANR